MLGEGEEPTPCSVEEGHGQRGESGVPRCSSQRRGDGTSGRNTDVKQGCSPRHPRPGRRAKTMGITSSPGKAGGVGESCGSGRSSGEGRDTITRPEPRTRGPGWSRAKPEAGWEDKTTREGRKAEPRRRPYQTTKWWEHADLALNPSGLSRKGGLIGKTPRLEAGLGKTHCPEF